jgi:hypothetical protein
MSSIDQIVNSINNIFEYGEETPEKIISFILVEKWNHNDYEELEFHNLNEWEIDLISAWMRINIHSYNKIRPLIQDIVEVFPGLSKIAASWIAAPYFGNSRLRLVK